MQDATKNDDIQANPDELATCQCIISHPEKPKFLALKHSTGFLPPQVKVPVDAVLGTNVPRVIEGVLNKYGLRTTLLRHVARYRDYQCVELEMHGSDGRRMQAVWVGLDDYRRMRGEEISPLDPLARWLQERERGEVSALRPPWERYGFFRGAAHWIDFQLDRMNLQARGSVSQQRALLHASTMLQVPTAAGSLWFKAAYGKPPLEVPLTAWLGRTWPELAPQPLAMEESRNWMLLPDYRIGAHRPAEPADFELAARAMGRLQAESLAHLGQLRGLGCEAQGAERLREFLCHPELGRSLPEAGEGSLTEAEREELAAVAAKLGGLCDELGGCGVPDLLVHVDFRAPNLFVGPTGVRIIDWANACIAPPAFCLLTLLHEDRPQALAELESDPVVQAWLEPMRALDTAANWDRALALSARLWRGWQLMRWSQEFAWFEPGGVAEANARRLVTGLVRKLIAAERDA